MSVGHDDGAGDLAEVRQGLRMATPPDPAKLEQEKATLRELDRAPLGRRWAGYLKFIGPGYLQSAMTLGSGTAMSSLFAGAVFGYQLLWVAPLGMLLGIVVMGVVSHQTLSTGQRVLPAMSTHAGKWLAGAFALAAVVASIVWHFPQYNLAAASLSDAAARVGFDGLPQMASSTIVLVWAVLLSSMYGKSARLVRIYERFLKYTVWGIVLLLAWVVVNTDTDWGAVARGFVPSLPEERNGISSSDLVVAGLAAAVGINMLLLYPYSLLARGWGREHRGLARFDLFAGMLVPYALASSLMVIAAANTLVDKGVAKTAAIGELGAVLGQVMGPVQGTLLFDLGMLAMALSTITLHMVCCGFVAMEWFGLPFGSLKQRLCMLLPVPGFLAPLFWGKLAGYLAIPTTILCGAMLPIAYVGFLILQRSKRYLGDDRPRGVRGFVATAGLVVAGIVMVAAVGPVIVAQVAKLFG
ncbi:MAG: Nramp family divalent metal transporter [Planctomycetes bacterium]|nr:Nramp family divalent metal transporter [Planctomycetota bacterium]